MRSPTRAATAWVRRPRSQRRQASLRARRGQIDESLVEQAGGGVQGRLVDRVVLAERDERLLDGALAQDEDQAGHPLVDRHEVDPTDVGVARLGRRREAGRPRHRRQGRGGQAEPVLAGELHLPELVADHQLLDRGERDRVRDGLDVEAIALVGGDPARGGVRVGQKAGGLELGEDAADGRAGHTEVIALDERLAADRRGGRDVFLDDGPKDRLGAEVQRAGGVASATSQRCAPVRVSTLWVRVPTVCRHRSSRRDRVSTQDQPISRENSSFERRRPRVVRTIRSSGVTSISSAVSAHPNDVLQRRLVGGRGRDPAIGPEAQDDPLGGGRRRRRGPRHRRAAGRAASHRAASAPPR